VSGFNSVRECVRTYVCVFADTHACAYVNTNMPKTQKCSPKNVLLHTHTHARARARKHTHTEKAYEFT